MDVGRLERLNWNAFKKTYRANDPIASKVDYIYYQRVRESYKAQTERLPTLDQWIRNGKCPEWNSRHSLSRVDTFDSDAR